MVFSFAMGSVFLVANGYQRCMLLDNVSMYLIILYLLSIKYMDIPYSNVFSKVRWSFPILWVLSSVSFILYLKWNPIYTLAELEAGWGTVIPKSEPFRHGFVTGVFWILYKPAFFGFMFWKTYVLENRYRLISDTVNNKDTFICLSRPQNAKSMCQALVGMTIGSVCIYSGGYLYGYRWGKPEYQKRKIPPIVIERKFLVVNILPNKLPELDKLIGNPAGVLRMKCVYVIKDVLMRIDPKLAPRWYELLPSRYGIKVLKWRKTIERHPENCRSANVGTTR